MFVFMGIMPRWMFLAILLREGIVTGYRIAAITKGKFLAAEWAGKYKTVMQMSSVFLVLVFLMLRSVGVIADLPDAGHGIWREGIYIIMFFTVVLTLLSGISYLWNNRKTFLESRR
jgi:CDP-diacylglycerol--glycerol-3-phosphate 3-phosphatidyltransferase